MQWFIIVFKPRKKNIIKIKRIPAIHQFYTNSLIEQNYTFNIFERVKLNVYIKFLLSSDKVNNKNTNNRIQI